MDHEHNNPPDDLLASNWLEEGQTLRTEEKASSEFGQWLAELRDCELADKAARLWQLFKEGKLSGPDKALVVAALLYCISPIDLTPDILPVVGYLDDLLVVLGVLTYLDRKTE